MCSITFFRGLKEKCSFLENTRSSLQPVYLELHREERSSQDKLSLQKAVQRRVRFKKSSQETRTGYVCLLKYIQLHGSTCLILGRFFLVLENKHSYFHRTRQVEPFMLHCFECLSEADFYQLLQYYEHYDMYYFFCIISFVLLLLYFLCIITCHWQSQKKGTTKRN